MLKRYIKFFKSLKLAFHLLMPLRKFPIRSILTVIATVLKNTFDLHSSMDKNNDKILYMVAIVDF